MPILCSCLRWAVVAVLAVGTLPGFAAEVAVLKNGFTIQHERRETLGELTRLYMSADGSSYVDVPTAEIDHYEEAPPAPVSTSPAKNPTGSAARAKRSLTFPERPQSDLSDVINQASGRYSLDPDLVNSVIKAESGFHVHAVSPKGAQGLMQLMPGTASQLGVPNAFDPQANVDGGTRYLRELLERYNFDLIKALAAYNAGPQRVEQFGGVPPYYETRAYVAQIVKDFNKKKLAERKASATPKKSAVAQRPRPKPSTSAAAKNRHSNPTAQARATAAPSE
jgi:hypothetical protein